MHRVSSLRTIVACGLVVSFFLAPRALTQPAQRPQDPSPQPWDLIRIELTPLDLLSKLGEDPCVVGSKVRLRMVAKNDSDQRMMIRSINPYYQNRPRLFKGAKLIPYRAEISRIVRSKDVEPEFINPGRFIPVEPYSSADLKQINLADWYGPLEAGSYRLTNRYRFEIGGPWSAESKPVSFKVIDER